MRDFGGQPLEHVYQPLVYPDIGTGGGGASTLGWAGGVAVGRRPEVPHEGHWEGRSRRCLPVPQNVFGVYHTKVTGRGDRESSFPALTVISLFIDHFSRFLLSTKTHTRLIAVSSYSYYMPI